VERAREALACDTIDELTRLVEQDAGACARVVSHLTVNWTQLFRDPHFYRALRERVVTHLRTYPALRIWVAGCSSGEEAYSIAVLLREEGLLERSLIYATDIDAKSLDAAKEGVFDVKEIAAAHERHRASGAPESLVRHYTAAYGKATFDRDLRARIVFSDHCLATDAVFAEVQLVTCRNVLMYFGAALQTRAVELFASSLCHGGFLGLGRYETLSDDAQKRLFVQEVPRAAIYRRRHFKARR
jgi:chemotaxis protein methyltransferase CheR